MRRLHDRLVAYGLEIAPNERKRGYFGPSTRAVVGDFQRAQGIQRSCEGCEKTLAALMSSPAVGEVASTGAIAQWPSEAQQASATTSPGRNPILSSAGTTIAETVRVWEKHTAFQTADAAQSIAYTFNLANNAGIHLDVLVTAINSGKTAGASFKRSADFRNNDGTAAQINDTQDGGSNLDAGLIWQCTIDCSGSSARVLVTGAANTTVRWGIYVSVMETDCSSKYPATHMLGSQRNGVNHVSMNLGDFNRVTGPIRGTNYPIYSDALLDWYQAKKVKSVRFMFTWEAVQSTLNGPVPATGQGYAGYWSDLTSVVTRLLNRDIYVILSPWQYNTASGDTDIVYDDAAFSSGHFADFWGKFATAINGATGNDQRVAFDLINEPHTHAESGNKQGDIGISLADWFTCAQAAITAIRDAGATNTIFVPGMAYANASSFTTNGSSTEWLKLGDPKENIAVTVHCYIHRRSDKLSTTALRDSCAALVSWARTYDIKVNVGEIAIDAGANGRPTYCSTFAIGQAQWDDWNRFCVSNNDVLVGWNWWGNSAAGWWNQGDSCDEQGYHWGLTLDDGRTQTIYMDLIEATLPAPLLYIPDHIADTGLEPETTTRAWESPRHMGEAIR